MKLRLCLACVLAALSPSTSDAWNSIGHLAVAKLAYDRLEDGHKTKIFAILKSHPHYEMFLAAGRPDDVPEIEWVFLRAGVWPDWVRPRDKQDKRGQAVTKYHRGEDHYINIPFVDPKDQEALAGKTLVNPDLPNIVTALKHRSNVLVTPTASDEDKAIALCWIYHLVGDIHQPLHNVAYFTRDGDFARGDMGGNRFGVRVNGRPLKLHMYWDDLLGDDPQYTDDSPARQKKIHEQAVTLAQTLRGLNLPRADLDRLTANTTFASWSQESFDLARTVAYLKADGTGLLEPVVIEFGKKVPKDAKEVGKDYAQRARTTAEIRILMAAHRLADRLKLSLR